MLYNEAFTDLLPHLGHVFLFTRLEKSNDSVKQMEKIYISSSCRNLISSNSCLALYKHEVRGSLISNQSSRLTFPANCAHRADGRGGVLRGEHHHGGGADGLMCSCLCPLMPSPISCMTKSRDLSHRKSPDTCRRKLYFNTTPLGLRMTLSAL